ncbi:MAG: hypothetical protein FE834_06965 [Gammaproteobacteria bacterium]|nr:hypothetical protein [Gammaproteobacteria bacterium]
MENNNKINYFELVERCASKKIDVEIANGKIEHAQILLEAMLRHGKKSVNIFTGRLDESLYASEKFKIWVDIYHRVSDGTLNFVIQSIADLQKHPLYAYVKAIDPNFDRIKFFIVKSNSAAFKNKNHFATMDGLAYREEVDDRKIRAIANFNDEKKNKELQATFNNLVQYQSIQYSS